MYSLLVVGVALATRLIRLLELRAEISWDHLLGDARTHQLLAAEIAGRDFWGHEAFYRAPLYPYFLGVLERVLGPSLFYPRLLQILLGAGSSLLVYLIGRRFLKNREALVAGLLCALNWVMIQYDVELEIAGLIVFFNLLGIWLLLPMDRLSPFRAAAAGLAFGLSALTRADVLLPAGLAVLWVFHAGGRTERARRLAACVFLGLILPVAGVTLRNGVVGHDLVLIASQGGVNFFIGNNEAADGRTWVQPVKVSRAEYRRNVAEAGGAVWARDNIWLVSKAGAEKALGRPLRPSEVSSYWFSRGVHFIVTRPAAALGLMVRKIYFLMNRWELHSGVDLHTLAGQSSALLRALSWLHWGILLPLALAGIAVAGKRSGPSLLLLLLIAGYALAIVAFFVNSRFRIPLIPLLALFAAQGVGVAWEALRRRDSRTALLYGGVLLAGLLVSNSSLAGARDRKAMVPIHNQLGDLYLAEGRKEEALREYAVSLSYASGYEETYQSMGVAYTEAGQFENAEKSFVQALRIDPAYALAHANRGWLREKQAREDEAVVSYGQALEIDSTLTLARNRLAMLLARRGKLDAAAQEYRAALRQQPDDPMILSNLAQTYAMAGKYQEAIPLLRRALERNPDQAQLHHNLGILLHRSGDTEAALAEFRRSLALDPSQSAPRARIAAILEEAGGDTARSTHVGRN